MAQTLQNQVQDIKNKMSTEETPNEGKITKLVEKQTGKVPSIGFLGLAVGSMALSAGFMLFGQKKEIANFVGLWAPSFLLIGIYNKLVKLEGSDIAERHQAGQSAA